MNYKLILDDNSKFKDAIELLDKNGNGVLPVVDINNKFIGLITDGDIRKAILNNHLDLEHIINKNPCSLDIHTSVNQRVQYLKKIHRRHLPLTDNNNIFITMFTLDQIEFNQKDNAIVIMAGGLGTRLGELTKDIPKPMLHVGSKPILELIINKFINYGFHNFYIAVNYKKEVIKNYFQDGKNLGISIKYLEENKRLGTAGALSLIEENLTEPIIITNGDILSDIDFDELLKYHNHTSAHATMCTREYEHIVPYGVIEVKNNLILSMKEKPKMNFFINTGVYVINPNLLSSIPKNDFFDMPSLFDMLIDEGKAPSSYNAIDYWIDIGKKEDYKKANDDILNTGETSF